MDCFTSEYARLCQKLGDLVYKNQQISKLIAETESQISAVNLLASKAKEKKTNTPEDLEKAAEVLGSMMSQAQNVRK